MGCDMKYKMEELVPIVAELTGRYTSKESTSVSYETANQLMGAVLYCIREFAETAGDGKLQTEQLSARAAYEIGYDLATQKVKKALSLYHEMLEEFDSYGNYYLEETIRKGMPEFFKWYDLDFHPQDTILTLDYPVTEDVYSICGIDAIYVYLQCVQKEQRILGKMDRNQVIDILEQYNPNYKEMPENLYMAVFSEVMKQIQI